MDRGTLQRAESCDSTLPDVHFSSSSDDDAVAEYGGGRSKGEDGDDDVIFIGHVPAAKRHCDRHLRSFASTCSPNQHSAARVDSGAEELTRGLSPHVSGIAQSSYVFTHYRRCSADIAAALKAKDADTLVAILATLHRHSEASAPPIPSHKIRERMLLLASNATIPQFLSNSTVTSVASAIQDLWIQNVSAALSKAKRKGATVTKVKSKSKGKVGRTGTKQKRHKKRGSSTTSGSIARASKRNAPASADGARGGDSHLSKVERRERELRAGYVPCTLAGCLRTFTSQNSMLYHLRDKHNVLDERLANKQKKKKDKKKERKEKKEKKKGKKKGKKEVEMNCAVDASESCRHVYVGRSELVHCNTHA